jgi:uncharacterized protein (TIGR03435 family)
VEETTQVNPAINTHISNSASIVIRSQRAPFTALQEQLGFKLERQKGTVEIPCMDHVGFPSAN